MEVYQLFTNCTTSANVGLYFGAVHMWDSGLTSYDWWWRKKTGLGGLLCITSIGCNNILGPTCMGIHGNLSIGYGTWQVTTDLTGEQMAKRNCSNGGYILPSFLDQSMCRKFVQYLLGEILQASCEGIAIRYYCLQLISL